MITAVEEQLSDVITPEAEAILNAVALLESGEAGSALNLLRMADNSLAQEFMSLKRELINGIDDIGDATRLLRLMQGISQQMQELMTK